MIEELRDRVLKRPQIKTEIVSPFHEDSEYCTCRRCPYCGKIRRRPFIVKMEENE